MAPKMTLMGKFKGIAEEPSAKQTAQGLAARKHDQIEMHGIQKY